LRRIGQYVRLWERWLVSGVRDVIVSDAFRWPVDGVGQHAFVSPPTVLTYQALTA
jgi:hypothetical protein